MILILNPTRQRRARLPTSRGRRWTEWPGVAGERQSRQEGAELEALTDFLINLPDLRVALVW